MLTLSYPISTNQIWRRAGKRIYLNPKVHAYRQEVLAKTLGMSKFGKQSVMIELRLFPRDKRVRDIDNGLKAILDALKHAQVFDDDSQVKKLVVEMCEVRKGGEVEVMIREWV